MIQGFSHSTDALINSTVNCASHRVNMRTNIELLYHSSPKICNFCKLCGSDSFSYLSLLGIQTNVFDVLLLFDGSSYLGSSHFRQSLLFAKAVLLNYNISREQTNVAAAVYASNVTISFNFTNFYSYSDVAAAIDQIPFLDDTPLNIEKALRVAKTNIFPTGRLNVPNVLVVFVSFSLSGNFAVISQALRDDGVKIIVIGIGSSFDTPQLEGVASTSDNVITTGYQHMDTVHGAVGGAVCQGKVVSNTNKILN